MRVTQPTTVAELRASGYQSKSVKQELRDNLVTRLKAGAPLFPGIVGYEDTVLPQVETRSSPDRTSSSSVSAARPRPRSPGS